jgi:hypothetical protein
VEALTSTPRGENLETRPFCPKSDQMSLNVLRDHSVLSNAPKLGQTSLSKCQTLGMASFVKPPNVACPPPLGLNIDRCIITSRDCPGKHNVITW